MFRPIIIIPARLAAARLPNKPLAMIHGQPMIVHVWRRAMEADVGPVYIATDATEIADAARDAGATAIMTRADHQSGSDRVFEALLQTDPSSLHDAIVNLQGDLPSLEPQLIADCVRALDNGADIGTLAAEIRDPAEVTDPNVVKVVGSARGSSRLRALYFTRASAPTGPGPLYHHIGLYAYRRDALARFVSLPQSPLEKRERLEQLRALEAGMTVDVAVVDTVPLGVDTPADLERCRAEFMRRAAS